MNNAAFDEIVSGFYRAATGEEGWSAALGRVQASIGARFAILHTLDVGTGRLLSIEVGGPDPSQCLFDYLRRYHELDPRRNRSIRLGEAGFGTWRHCTDVFDDAFVASHPFYQDFALAHDVRFGSHVVLPIKGSVGTGFALELPKSRGPLDADERDLMRRLGEHMRDALRAHRRVRSLVSKMLAGHSLLQTFPYPMWLIEASRDIVYSNPAARHEEDLQRHLIVKNGHLALFSARADRALTERLHRLAHAAHGSSTVIKLDDHTSATPVWLHCALLVPGAVLGAFGDTPQFLVTLFDPSHVSALDPFALTNMFDLTPSEARVASRLADGLAAHQIAELHGTRVTTVRTQVREVLHKLGASRTVDVVRLLRQGHALWPGASLDEEGRPHHK